MKLEEYAEKRAQDLVEKSNEFQKILDKLVKAGVSEHDAREMYFRFMVENLFEDLRDFDEDEDDDAENESCDCDDESCECKCNAEDQKELGDLLEKLSGLSGGGCSVRIDFGHAKRRHDRG